MLAVSERGPLHGKAAQHMSTGHVLLLDDDEVFLEATAAALRSVGYRVQTAAHFEPALQILEGADCPEVLIVDIVMPSSVNGVALARMARLRQPKLGVNYVTGFDFGAEQPRLAGPLLRKPVDREQLVAAIAMMG